MPAGISQMWPGRLLLAAIQTRTQRHRLVAARKPIGVMNVGTGGNRLLNYGTGSTRATRDTATWETRSI
jgi:hypothetical protein